MQPLEPEPGGEVEPEPEPEPAAPFALDSEELPPGLRHALRTQRCVLYTGSGFSVPAGLPSFGELLVSVARDGGVAHLLGCAASANDAAAAASVVQGLGKDAMFALQGRIVSTLGKQKAGELFMQHLRPASPLPAEMMARLHCIRGTQYAFVVTQNWDDLLERAGYERCVPPSLNDYGVPLVVMAGAGAGQQRCDTVVKFESDGGTAESWLLSSSEIAAVSDEFATPTENGYAFWTALLTNWTVVFAGCSIEGGYIGKMLRATFSESRPQHFAIMGNVAPQARRCCKDELGVAVFDYSFDEHEGHPAGGLLAYLEYMRDASVQRNEKNAI